MDIEKKDCVNTYSQMPVYMVKTGSSQVYNQDDMYFYDERLDARENDPSTRPPLWAFVTCLVLIGVALVFTITTLGLEANMYRQQQIYIDNTEPSDSSNLLVLYLILIALGLADSAASTVTLIVCFVLTAAAPRLVLKNPATHGSNCLCATICILACVSGMSIGTFASMEAMSEVKCPRPLAVPIIRTVLTFAYFAVLIAAQCVERH